MKRHRIQITDNALAGARSRNEACVFSVTVVERSLKEPVRIILSAQLRRLARLFWRNSTSEYFEYMRGVKRCENPFFYFAYVFWL